MSSLINLLTNLSFSKYEYNTIFETALEQLDHLFLVIGNGYDYDPVRGPIIDGKGLLESQVHDFDKAVAYHTKRFNETATQYDKYLADYEDMEVPERILEMVREAKEMYAIPEFKLMESDYYFNPEIVAAESIAKTNSENNKRWGGEHWRTPYPISEYSFITLVRKTDDPVLVELALCTAKAWKIVLDYYKENGLYLTQEQVDSSYNPGAVYYQSIMHMDKTYAELSAIITELEKDDA
ncbi:hypothetical protein XbC2_531 [Xanthomonas phage XbC2]|nr:hypothetical protein XbC2_531 [Xanthomonas phage XbC2]